jgi:hypothetical protein
MLRAVFARIIGVFIGAALAHAQDNCADVLRSVYDITNRTERLTYSHSFYSFMCDSTYSSYQSAREAGAKVGVVIDELPIEFGGYSRDTQWAQYQRTPTMPPPPPRVTTVCLMAGGYDRFPVRNGEQVQIRSYIKDRCSAQGWSCDGWKTASGPDGVPHYRVASAIDPNSNIGTLLGAFSTADVATPEAVAGVVKSAGPLHVGGAFNGASPVNGYLYVIFNDDPSTFADNAGGVAVEFTQPPQFDVLTVGVRLLQER